MFYLKAHIPAREFVARLLPAGRSAGCIDTGTKV